MDLFKKFFNKNEDQNQAQTPVNPENENQETQEEEVTVGTKIKVVAALLVVGFAAYIAYWIQEPVEVRTDILGSSSMQSGTQGMTTQTGDTQQVAISNYSFQPATISITPGTTVVWTNQDTVPHNVVGDNFTSSTLNPGDSFTYAFNDGGSFSYQSSFDPQMKGYIIVGTPAAPSTEQILSGFGAGSSFGLGGTTSTGTNDTSAVQTPQTQAATEQAVIPPPLTEPDTTYPNSASAPAPSAADLHNAAYQSLSASLSNIGSAATAAQAPASAAAQQPAMTAAAEQAATAASASMAIKPVYKGKLASSGPEDYVYGGMFALTLFLNRRKLGKSKKSNKKTNKK